MPVNKSDDFRVSLIEYFPLCFVPEQGRNNGCMLKNANLCSIISQSKRRTRDSCDSGFVNMKRSCEVRAASADINSVMYRCSDNKSDCLLVRIDFFIRLN